MMQKERGLYLIRRLLEENREYAEMTIPEDEAEQRQLLRGLMNIRMPQEADEEFLTIQDAYLKEVREQKGIVNIADLDEAEPGIVLWKGDITRLKIDAIVNAANSGMTGCYRPNHNCIDNCIHTFAGVRLRSVCQKQMDEQGH